MASSGISHFYIRRVIIVWNYSFTLVIHPWFPTSYPHDRDEILRIWQRSRSQVNTHFSFRRQVAVMDPEHAGGVVPVFVWVDGWGGLFPPKKKDLDSMNCWEIFVLLLRDTGRTFRRFWLCVVCICVQFSTSFACQSRWWLRWRRVHLSMPRVCVSLEMHARASTWFQLYFDVLGMRLSGIPHEFDDLRAPRAGRHLIEFDVTQISHSLAIDDFIAQILTGQVEMDYTCKYVYNNLICIHYNIYIYNI